MKFKLFLINPEMAARNILAQMTETVFLLNPAGEIISINLAGLSLLNYTERELLGKNVLEFLTEQYRSQSSFNELLNHVNPSQQHEFELEFLTKEGRKIPVSISNSLLNSEDNKEVKGIVWLSKDITKQKQLEEQQQKTELVRKELEEKKHTFITMTSHELRTPLTAILGYTEFLEKTIKSDFNEEVFTHQLGIVKKNALRLDRLTRGLMDINQIDEQKFRIKKENVNFLDFLEESFSIYKQRLKDRFLVEISHDISPILLNMDSDRINQVLVNIIDNATKNSGKENLHIHIKLEITPETVHLSITDQGPGIEKKYLEHIFEKFVSIPTKNSVIGSGIGLYVSRMIIKAHGGRLYAESEGMDRGATFHIILPR